VTRNVLIQPETRIPVDHQFAVHLTHLDGQHQSNMGGKALIPTPVREWSFGLSDRPSGPVARTLTMLTYWYRQEI
jgi:hypothetical protein